MDDMKTTSAASLESFSTESSNAHHPRGQPRLKIANCLRVSLSCLLMTSLVGLAILVIVYGIILNEKVTALEKKVKSLETEQNQTLAIDNHSHTKDQNQELRDQIADLRSLIIVAGNDVEEEISDITESTNHSIFELWEQIEEIKESFSSFNISGCYEERKQCSATVDSTQSRVTYKGCKTDPVPSYIPVSR